MKKLTHFISLFLFLILKFFNSLKYVGFKATCKKDVQFKYIIADFGKITTIAEYREIFGTAIENIDIGLVIANAGMA